jgi:hypothetical protein
MIITHRRSLKKLLKDTLRKNKNQLRRKMQEEMVSKKLVHGLEAWLKL